MRLAILQANLGNFDKPVDPCHQNIPADFHRFTDDNFPSNRRVEPRLRYRAAKTYGWMLKPGYDAYIWLDGVFSFKRDDCAQYYLDQLADGDMGFFAHPDRSTIADETQYVYNYLNRLQGRASGQNYIIERYAGGGHLEQLAEAKADPTFVDDKLYHSGTFIYRNTPKVQAMLAEWLYTSVRYYTVDQIALPYLIHKHQLGVRTFSEPVYKSGYCSLVGHHK